MDSTLDYGDLIEKVIREYAHPPSHGEIEPEVIIDREKGHYELMFMGWDKHKRVHGR
ncbi:MAG: XisI protein, partial [Sphaerospermopsis sp. SIO1G2]|nr:XisI protein [Sphaerospermopsis sp. SIO1G2]